MLAAIERLKQEAFNIRTVDLISKSKKIAERLFWFLVAFCGVLWFFTFMASQVNIWKQNRVLITKADVKLSDLDYPAVTFCSKTANKYGIAERFGNYLDPKVDQNQAFFSWLRSIAVSCALQYIKKGNTGYNLATGEKREVYNDFCLALSGDPTSPKCEIVNSIYHCKDDSLSMEDVFEDVFQHLVEKVPFSKWDVGKTAMTYAKIKYTCNMTQPIVEAPPSEDQDYIESLLLIFGGHIFHEHYNDHFNWKTESIGTWTSKIRYSIDRCLESNGILSNSTRNLHFEKEIDGLFTVHQDSVSLLDIAEMFSVIDAAVLIREKEFLSLATIDPHDRASTTLKRYTHFPLVKGTFKACFKILIENHEGSNFPCSKPIAYQECVEYCEWHEQFTREINYNEFLILMKYGLPQRKWISEPVQDVERDLAIKLFGESKVMISPTSLKSPVPFAMLCESKLEGFKGQDINEWTQNSCDSFFPTPTDQGFCMTENFDVKEVLHEHEKYDILMEHGLQKQTTKIQGGTLWSPKTFVISTQNEPHDQGPLAWRHASKDKIVTNKWDLGHCRDDDCNFYSNGEIQLQVHDSRDFGHMINEPDFVGGTEAILLKRGWEYFIDIYPVGSRSSNQYKSLSLEERQCLMEDEIPKNSIFKKYSEKNCKYECHTRLARDTCRCTPWDFVLQNQETTFKQECDVFGRTCFYDTMKNLTQSTTDFCPHCLDLCDNNEFRKVVVKKNVLPNFDNFKGNYLFDFMMNSTFMDPALVKFEAIIRDFPDPMNLGVKTPLSRTMIVVHFRYIEPDMDKVDLTYTVWDKFANLGGNFGIFAEITGISFLGMLNAIILIFKLAATKIKSMKKKSVAMKIANQPSK